MVAEDQETQKTLGWSTLTGTCGALTRWNSNTTFMFGRPAGNQHSWSSKVSSAVPVTDDTFIQAYLAGALGRFFECSPGESLQDLPPVVLLERPRSELVAALRVEAERLHAPRSVFAQLDRLAHPASRVVVTGQQAGLLLGPNYSLIKTISAIALAARLDEEDAPVIPVFWLASQDHDSAEVDHTWLLDMNEQLHRVAVELPAEVPISAIAWDDAWLTQISRVIEAAEFPAAFRNEVLALLHEAAAGAQWFGDFFVRQLYLLLGDCSPVVLDPGRPQIAALFSPVLQREINQPDASVRAITDAGAELRSLGFTPQLGRAADATDLFITEQRDGLPRRQLLRWDGQLFHTAARSYSRSDLLEILAAEPGRITPAAGLRPVTQDAVLPTVAFVVGPGELRYLAQLGGVYELHGLKQPLIWPRTEATIIEPPVRRILQRYGLTAREYQQQRSEARERVLLERSNHADRFVRALQVLEAETAELLAAVEGIDPTLVEAVRKQREQFRAGFLKLQKRTASALETRDGITSSQVDRLEAQLFPGGTAQERLLSPWSFMLKFGVAPVMKLLLDLPAGGTHLLEL
jgi:bacillithiol biosynthesis cysteine-adding enzyme BshC